MPVSGSAPGAGQLVPPLALPMIDRAEQPFTSPTIGGL
jgi:hypothetical protein